MQTSSSSGNLGMHWSAWQSRDATRTAHAQCSRCPRGQSVRTGTAASSLKPVLLASCSLSAVLPLACPFRWLGPRLVIQALVAQHNTTGLFKGTPRWCGIGAPLKVMVR